jgi:hypothetical protein
MATSQSQFLKASIAYLIILLFLSPPPSEFCTDEDNSVIRLAMDTLRYSKK